MDVVLGLPPFDDVHVASVDGRGIGVKFDCRNVQRGPEMHSVHERLETVVRQVQLQKRIIQLRRDGVCESCEDETGQPGVETGFVFPRRVVFVAESGLDVNLRHLEVFITLIFDLAEDIG